MCEHQPWFLHISSHWQLSKLSVPTLPHSSTAPSAQTTLTMYSTTRNACKGNDEAGVG